MRITGLALVGLLLLTTGVGPSAARTVGDVGASLQALAKYRMRAQENAALLTAVCAAGRRCDGRYEYYGLLHNRTVTAFTNLITVMVKKMQTPELQIPAVYSQYTIEDAAVHIVLLERAFRRLSADAGQDDAADMRRRITVTQREIADSLRALASAYMDSPPVERHRVVAGLSALAWDRFEEIRPHVAAATD